MGYRASELGLSLGGYEFGILLKKVFSGALLPL
jgi:hypothetical protein